MRRIIVGAAIIAALFGASRGDAHAQEDHATVSVECVTWEDHSFTCGTWLWDEVTHDWVLDESRPRIEGNIPE